MNHTICRHIGHPGDSSVISALPSMLVASQHYNKVQFLMRKTPKCNEIPPDMMLGAFGA
jgi:hypothetical protein